MKKYLLLLIISFIYSETIHVPDDFATIEEAINYSQSGDTISVASGTYYERILDYDFTKSISIIGSGSELTQIRSNYIDFGNTNNLIFHLRNSSIIDLNVHFEGLTLTQTHNGYALTFDTSGNNTSLITLSDVVFKDNHSALNIIGTGTTFIGDNLKLYNNDTSLSTSSLSGVLYFSNIGHGTLTNSQIYNNISEGYSTIHAYYSDFSMDRVLIHSNTNHTGGGGGAIDVKGTNSPLVEINRCTIINNHGRLGGGVRAEDYSDILINSSIIRNNTCLTNNNYSAQIDITSSSADIAVKFSNIQNSGITDVDADVDYIYYNIDEDPLFVDSANGDYSLQEGSPCIDAGDPTNSVDPDGTTSDIGAFYFHQTIIGCMNPSACNYNPEAIIDNGSCAYIEDCTGECGGNAIEDCFGVCGGDGALDDCGVCGGDNTLDDCGECGGNGYDMCDDDDDGVTNLEQWGYGAHTAVVNDIAEDQGGRVHLQFNRSFYDTDSLSRSEVYTIERKDGDIWMAVQSIGAYGADQYNAEATTLYNNTTTEFRIIASMDEGNFETIESIEGISIDNINPSTPDNVFASDNEDNVSISWDYEQDIDFNYHQITGLYNTLYTTENQIDISVPGYNEYYINSVDVNENLSDKSEDISAHNLHYGMNLVSFSVLPEDNDVNNILSSNDVIQIVGEGIASIQVEPGLWVGSLNIVEANKGYWVKSENGDVLSVVGEKQYNTLYNLHFGNNLISYTCSNPSSLSELITNEDIVSIIGEGVAATYNQNFGWIGSLNTLEPGKGYWFNAATETELTYECLEELIVSERENELNEIKNYAQSTQQAFYFFEDIENVEIGDRIESYCNNTLVGSRVWIAPYMDVPAMGQDNQEITQTYCMEGSVPTFKLIKESGAIFELVGNVPAWENNQVFMVEDLNIELLTPEKFSLSSAYPNPFNPSTTIDFSIPSDSFVSIEIYDIRGRKTQTLANTTYQPGYYSLSWDASDYSSGVYFIKMQSEGFLETQKLMLVK